MVLRNFTRNLHMFLDSFELSIENNKINVGKTVLNMWSQICGRIAMLIHKVTLGKKVQKSKKSIAHI